MSAVEHKVEEIPHSNIPKGTGKLNGSGQDLQHRSLREGPMNPRGKELEIKFKAERTYLIEL